MTTIREALFALCSLTMLIVCVSGNSADASFRDELLARIVALEDQGRDQTDKVQQMEMRLVDQHARLVRQETTIHEYKQRVAVLERTVTELQHEYRQRVALLEQTVAEVKQRQDPGLSEDFSALQDFDQAQDSGEQDPSLRIQQRTINMLRNKEAAKLRSAVHIVGDSGPVAFHAVIKQYGEIRNIVVGQHIVFPDVMLNTGGGYNNLRGVFTAPQPGIYLFSTSIVSYTTTHPLIAVNLMKNGALMARAYAHGDSGRTDQGSVTVVTQLAAGDEVWVSVNGPSVTSSYGEYYDSFTGCLITPV